MSQEPAHRATWRLEDFDVGRKLGEGRFGKIYLARESASKVAVALKCLSKEAILALDLHHQLRREIELHMFCRHRNILRMLAYFWDSDRIFLLLDFADEGDLAMRLAKYPRRRMPEVEAREVVRQLCSAVRYLHSHQIMHRDIKPENILFKQGVLKLADFSWAVLLHEYRGTTRRQTLCGTLDYLSPEIVEQSAYERPTDAWSVGVVTYELFEGQPPFDEATYPETCRRISAGAFADPAHASPLAVDFIRQLLRVDIKARMTMDEALQHPWLQDERVSWSVSSMSLHPAAPSVERVLNMSDDDPNSGPPRTLDATATIAGPGDGTATPHNLSDIPLNASPV